MIVMKHKQSKKDDKKKQRKIGYDLFTIVTNPFSLMGRKEADTII